MNVRSKVMGFALPVLIFLLTGCTTIDTKPFESFNESLVQLDKGATSTLDVTIPLTEARYRKELVDELSKKKTDLLSELDISPSTTDPFFVSKQPVFLTARKFKLAVAKTNQVWIDYSGLLLQLASRDLVDDDEFKKLSEELNQNAFHAVQALDDDPGNIAAENTAMFSTLAISIAEKFINTKQKEKLKESINANQDNIGQYVEHMQSAIVTMAQSSTQEHSEKQMELTRNLLGLIADNTDGKNQAKIQKVVGDMIDVKTTHLSQMESLRALHSAYAKIPAAHEALAQRLEKSDASIEAISTFLDKTIQLNASYQANARINKAALVQARADAANAKASAAEMRYQQARLKASEAQFEYTLAETDLQKNPDNATKQKAVETAKATADELTLEADNLLKSAEALRAAATAIQTSANEVKSGIINN